MSCIISSVPQSVLPLLWPLSAFGHVKYLRKVQALLPSPYHPHKPHLVPLSSAFAHPIVAVEGRRGDQVLLAQVSGSMQG